jgi:hypothetical protein
MGEIKSFIQRQWLKLKRYEFKKLFMATGILLEVLPGILAWLLEVVVMVSAIVCVINAGRLAYEVELYSAVALIVMAGMLVGLAILTDHYTAPQKEDNGGV